MHSVQSVLGGQPLLIVGVAEPIVLIYKFLYEVRSGLGCAGQVEGPGMRVRTLGGPHMRMCRLGGRGSHAQVKAARMHSWGLGFAATSARACAAVMFMWCGLT
eukprot:327306-Chlamydomonas_euryale.AAC.2